MQRHKIVDRNPKFILGGNTIIRTISRLLGSCALASLMGCASEPSVSSLTSAERQRVGEMVLFKAGAISRAGYRILGSVEGLSCKYTRDSNSPSMDEAMQGVRIRAAKLGADAVTNMVCKDQPDGGNRNCWQAVVCIGDAITVSDKSMLSHPNQGWISSLSSSSADSVRSVSSSPTEQTSGVTSADLAAAIAETSQRILQQRQHGQGSTAVVGSQVLSPSGNTQSRQRQPVENMNRCKQIRFIKGPNYDIWEFANNCPVPVEIAWCDRLGCKSPSSGKALAAGEKHRVPILGNATPEPGAVLYCPVDTFNTANAGVWACWPKSR